MSEEFIAQINAEWAAKQVEIRGKVIEVATYLSTTVIDRSPVLSGRFAGNWNASIGVPDPHTSAAVDPHKGATKTRAKNKLREYAAYVKYPPIYLSNALPYANRLENGWSRKAPNGVVAVSMANTAMKFRGVVL